MAQAKIGAETCQPARVGLPVGQIDDFQRELFGDGIKQHFLPDDTVMFKQPPKRQRPFSLAGERPF